MSTATTTPSTAPLQISHHGAHVFRTIVGVLAILVIGWVITTQEGIIAKPHTPELSALQVIQLYTQGCFYLIGVIGVAIAFYIASRWD